MQTFRIVGNAKRIIYLVIPAEAGIQSYFEFQKCAGFRPGGRGPFVSAKGPKTIDAPSGRIG
jgi:hypothetical protein